jgi:hypothetical protein
MIQCDVSLAQCDSLYLQEEVVPKHLQVEMPVDKLYC